MCELVGMIAIALFTWLISLGYEIMKEVRKMSDHRYHMQEGRKGGYAVIDMSTRGKVVMFASGNKRECIMKAQELNGFATVNGREDTYEQQLEGIMK